MQSEAKVRLKEELTSPLRVLQETARRIAKVSNESGIAVVEDEYVQSFKVEMMDVVLQWCKGAKFAEICKVCQGFLYSMACADYSSPTCLRARSFGVSADCRSLFDRWARRPMRSVTLNWRRSLRRAWNC